MPATGLLVGVLGDCALDVTVAPASPGRPPPGGDAPARIGLGAGGQGANVAVRLARAGVPARLAAPLAADAPGQLLRVLLASERLGIVALPAARSSVVVAHLDEQGERSMESDRASFAQVGAADLAAAMAACRWIHVSGYALGDPDEAAVVLAAIDRIRTGPAVRVSVGGGSAPRGGDAARTLSASLVRLAPDLVVFDLEESLALVGQAGDAFAAAAALAGPDRVAVVTSGGRGSAVAGVVGAPGRWVAAPTLPGEVLDATGAGDAFTAGLIAGLRAEPWPPASRALEAALVAASRLGGLVARVAGAQGRVAGEPDPLP